MFVYSCIKIACMCRLHTYFSSRCSSWPADCIKGCRSSGVRCVRLRLCCRALKCKTIMRIGSHVGGKNIWKLCIQFISVNMVETGEGDTLYILYVRLSEMEIIESTKSDGTSRSFHKCDCLLFFLECYDRNCIGWSKRRTFNSLIINTYHIFINGTHRL